MKKTAFILLCASFLFASCKSTFTATNYENPAVQVDAQTAAEMTVSPTRISYTYEPTSLTAKTGFDNILQTAVEEALKANGNADLLVDLKYSYVVKHKLYSDVYLSITVTGFPAKYTTFRPMQLYGYTPDGEAIYYENGK